MEKKLKPANLTINGHLTSQAPHTLHVEIWEGIFTGVDGVHGEYGCFLLMRLVLATARKCGWVGLGSAGSELGMGLALLVWLRWAGLPQSRNLLTHVHPRDGSYTGGVFKPTVPGKYRVEVEAFGRPAKDSPYDVLFQAAAAEKSFADGVGVEGGDEAQVCRRQVGPLFAPGQTQNLVWYGAGGLRVYHHPLFGVPILQHPLPYLALASVLMWVPVRLHPFHFWCVSVCVRFDFLVRPFASCFPVWCVFVLK